MSSAQQINAYLGLVIITLVTPQLTATTRTILAVALCLVQTYIAIAY